MSSYSQDLAALDALFQPSRAVVESGPPELPVNLDAHILADCSAAWEIVSYRWYRGTDTGGVQRIFRFQRGNSLEQWHETLQSQKLQDIFGPFRTQAHAQSTAR
jgi:hypothetical protein